MIVHITDKQRKILNSSLQFLNSSDPDLIKLGLYFVKKLNILQKYYYLTIFSYPSFDYEIIQDMDNIVIHEKLENVVFTRLFGNKSNYINTCYLVFDENDLYNIERYRRILILAITSLLEGYNSFML